MKYTIDHDVLSSFKEYAEYNLIKNGEAYTNFADIPLYRYLDYEDDKIKNKAIYGSQFCQLCYYNDIAGITTLSIKESGVSKAEGEDGLIIDRDKGRAIFDLTYNEEVVSIDGAIKDFNTYITSDPDEKIVHESLNNNLPTLKAERYVKNPYGIRLPAIFFKINDTYNEKYCLSGGEKTNWIIRAIIIANCEFSLTGVVSYFRDYYRDCFPFIGCENQPLNNYGGLKDQNWRYSDFLSDHSLPSGYISKVLYTPIQPTNFSQLNPNTYIGFCDFFIQTKR